MLFTSIITMSSSSKQPVVEDEVVIDENIEWGMEFKGVDRSLLNESQKEKLRVNIRLVHGKPFIHDDWKNGELVTRDEFMRRRVLGVFSTGGTTIG